MNWLRRLWSYMEVGWHRKTYIDLFSQGLVSRERMLEECDRTSISTARTEE